jgi:hypothetical protein
LKGAHIALAIAAMVAIHTGLSEPFLRRVGFSPSVALAAAVGGAGIAGVVGGSVLWRLRQRGAPMSGLMAVGMLLLTSLVWFALPALLEVGSTLVYASGAAALLHCAQYLWITFFVEGRLAFVQQRRFDGLGWGATVVGLGVVMFTLGPWIASKAFGYDLIVSLLIVQSVVNLHHFVVDAFVWKLRDPALSRPLFSGRELAAAHREQVGNGKAIALGEAEGFIKTIFDAKTGELLGAHMIGAEVTELIQGYTIGKVLETTEAELMQTIFPHPTLSEMMHESVLDAYGRALHF